MDDILYIVTIGYNDFSFDNPDDAMNFAYIAKVHYTDKRDIVADISVSVSIVKKLKQED